MAKKNWMTDLQKLEGAVVGNYNPHDHVLRSRSPSVNFAFGKGHGLPRGFTLALGGPPKGGKTLLTNLFTGQIHADDPEACVLKFNTEFREEGQATREELQRVWGIDPDRYQAFEVNSPMHIFDPIEKEIAAKCQEGFPLALVIIDSINGIQGRRALNADTIETQQIGDQALTLGDGFKRILAVQRKFKFSVILTCQIRAEMDRVEIMRHNTVKMSMPLAVQHYAEYAAFIEMNRNKEGRTDLAGNEFKDEEAGDIADNAEQTGHKIKMKMKDSSCGPKGRVAEFTLDYKKGIINTFEEVYLLGVNRGVIAKPSNVSHEFGDKKWTGKPAMLNAIKTDKALYDAILKQVFDKDRAGAFDRDDAKAE